MLCEGGPSPILTNGTISGSWGWGGGVCCDSGSSPTLTNGIVWGNTPESVCGNLSHCLTDRDPLFSRSGEWVDGESPDDPLCIGYHWGPDTDGPTAWHRWIHGEYHLQPGSPAIDPGTSEGAPTSDIEGHGCPCGAGVDMGAYEFGDCALVPTVFLRADSNADGRLDISDPVATLGYLFLGRDDLPCLDAADADDSGAADISDAVYSLNFLFTGGPAPPAPFGVCGPDGTADALGCEGFAACP